MTINFFLHLLMDLALLDSTSTERLISIENTENIDNYAWTLVVKHCWLQNLLPHPFSISIYLHTNARSIFISTTSIWISKILHLRVILMQTLHIYFILSFHICLVVYDCIYAVRAGFRAFFCYCSLSALCHFPSPIY